MENVIGLVCSLASATAAIASVFVTIIFGMSQRKQEKNAQRIAMFSIRYEVYKTVVRIYEFIRLAAAKNDVDMIPNYLFVANMVLEKYDLMENENYLSEQFRLTHLIKNASKDESDQADRDLYYLDLYANSKLLQLKGTILSEIRPSVFCFGKEIYNILDQLIIEFFDYIIIFKNGSGIQKERDNSALIKSMAKIEEMKVFEYMENCLSVDVAEKSH